MAKMINRIIQRFRLIRLNRVRDQKTFLESYLPIRVGSIETHTNQHLKMICQREEALLRPLAIAAGIPTPALEVERQAKIARIEDGSHWKAKALAQSRKRALAKSVNPDLVEARFAQKVQALETAKVAKIQAIQHALGTDGRNNPSAKIALQEQQAALASEADQRKKTLVAHKESGIAQVKNKYQTKIDKLGTQAEILHQRLISDQLAVEVGQGTLPSGVILGIRNLSMRFGGLKAVDDISFDVKQGEIFGLIGPNGAGKTTIFNCITRFYRATMGEMFFRKNPVEVIRLNDFPVHDIIRQGIVRTFQNVELVWELPILDNLLVAAHTIYRSGFFSQLFHTANLRREEEVMRAKAFGVLKTLGLLSFAYMYPFGLPYGILKKVELARTLMANPKLIILDEPAAGLNEKEADELAELIKRIRTEYHATIFLVEHDMGLVMNVCDTICAISFGKMLAIGTPAEIQANHLVRSAYLGEES